MNDIETNSIKEFNPFNSRRCFYCQIPNRFDHLVNSPLELIFCQLGKICPSCARSAISELKSNKTELKKLIKEAIMEASEKSNK